MGDHGIPWLNLLNPQQVNQAEAPADSGNNQRNTWDKWFWDTLW